MQHIFLIRSVPVKQVTAPGVFLAECSWELVGLDPTCQDIKQGSEDCHCHMPRATWKLSEKNFFERTR